MRLLAVNDADNATLSAWLPVNKALYSADPSNALWVKTGSTVTMNAITWNDGTLGHKLAEDSSTGNHMVRQNVTIDLGLNVISIMASAAERTFVRLWVFDSVSGASATGTFDLSAGTAVFASTGSLVSVAASMARSGPTDAWRCMLTINASITGSFAVRVVSMLTVSSASFTGTTGSGVYFSRLQVEASPVATTYMPTVASMATASGYTTTLPLANLQTEGRARVCRTTAVFGTQGIQVDFAATTPINCAVLYGHNLSYSAYIRLLCYDGPGATGNIIYDSGNQQETDTLWGAYRWPQVADARRFSVLWLPSLVNARSARLLVRDPSNSAGYWQAKRLLMGQYVEPARNYSLGLSIDWADDSTQKRTQAGSLRSDPQARYRVLSGKLDGLTEADRADLFEALGYAGKRREVFVSVFPGTGGDTERDYSLLGKVTKLPQYIRNQPLHSQTGALEIAES